MIVEKIKSEGLAHLSYLIGDSGEAAVIDPRRDCEIYIERAHEHGMRITNILETHRNEDLVSGAPALSKMTGAPVHHGPNLDGEIVYAETVREGDEFSFGSLKLRVFETPGHTFDSVSYAIYDEEFSDDAVGVFTGDALFIGDVGRTDFYPDRAEEVAGLLYDSLQKILSLGDQALIYPAHGAGSVCGAGMASREFSSLGYERLNNPRLQISSREAFIKAKIAEQHYIPPYFKTMERLNMEGGDAAARVLSPEPKPASLDVPGDARVIDVRDTTAFAGAHLPGALSLPSSTISSFAGWFLDEHEKLFLIADDQQQADEARLYLARIGYDHIIGVITQFVPRVASGKSYATTDTVNHEVVSQRLDARPDNWTLLDVRGVDEVEEYNIDGSRHVYLGHLPDEVENLDPLRSYTLMCGSGVRATIAASFLQAQGFKHIDVFLGSIGAWQAHHSAN